MADVFISYSRKDAEFVQRLNTAFVNAKRVVWVDWQDIPRGEAWWNAIEQGIEQADTFICMISENWLVSEICHKELLHARQNNKRVLPLIRQQIKDDIEKRVKGTWMDTAYEQMARDNWDYIRHLNWIFFEDDAKFNTEFTALLKTLDEDQPHIKAHTRYLTDALDWDRAARNPSFLMTGDNLTFAEAWLKDSAGKSPEPTDLQREYIIAGRRAEDELKARAALIQRRVLQFRWASRLLGFMAFLALGAAAVYGVLGTQAQERANIAGTQVIDANATLTQVPQTLTPVRITLQAGETLIARSDQQLATATYEQGFAYETLTPIPQTLTPAYVTLQAGETLIARSDQQLATATSQLGIAQQEADAAETQVAQAQATATQIPPTLTQAAITVAQAQVEQDIALQSSQATLELLQGDSAQALARMDAMVERYPNTALAYVTRGLVHAGMQNYTLAIEDFTVAITLTPEDSNLYNNRCIAYTQIDHYEAAIDDCNAAIALNPRYEEAYNNRGFAYYHLGDYEAAISDHNIAIELNPQYANAYNYRGNAYVALNDYESAMADYNTTIELDPQYVGAYNNRGNLYLTLMDYEAAIGDYTTAIEINPQLAESYYNRGLVYARMSDYETAIDDFTIAITLDEQFVAAYNNRGLAYIELGNYDAAIEDFNAALDIDPQLSEAYNNRGNAYAGLTDYEAAIDDYTTAIELDPQFAEAYSNRGIAYAGLTDYEAAIDDFNTALTIDPQYARAYLYRGVVYYLRATSDDADNRRSDLKQALEDWQRAEELGLELPSAVQNLIPEIENELASDE